MRVPDSSISVRFNNASQIAFDWTGVDGCVSWVYVNGVFSQTLQQSGTSKSATASVGLDKPVRVEIHELPDGTDQQYPCEPRDADEPWVYWQPSANAVSYTVRGRHQDTSVFQVLKTVTHDPVITYYQEEIQQEILRSGGCYWWMKVDAVSSARVSSAATAWPYEVMGLPPVPKGATMTRVGSGPSATLTLTIQV